MATVESKVPREFLSGLLPGSVVGLVFAAVFSLLAVSSMVQKSATFDEPNKLISGYSHLKWGDFRLVPDHPPMAKMLNALPLLFMEVPDPRQRDPRWAESVVSDSAQQFFTQALLYTGDADWLLFWGRVPVVVLAILLGFFVFFWARQLYGYAGATAALCLYGLDPNILAHARLATSDVHLALATFLSIYSSHRLLERFTPLRGLFCILSLTGCTLVKHTGWLAVLSVFALGILKVASRQSWPVTLDSTKELQTRKAKFLLLGCFGLFTALTIYFGIWAAYGFRYHAVPDLTPLSVTVPGSGPPAAEAVIRGLKAQRLFPEAYAEGLLLALSRLHLGHRFFLWGDHSTEGWWYFFFVAFFVKTPLPTLLLLALSVAVAVAGKSPLKKAEVSLLVPVTVYFLAAMISGYNLGLRYLLPVYPFLFVFLSRLVSSYAQLAYKGKKLATSLWLLWYIVATQNVYPHYLAYFNELVGGPEHGYRVLVDSNLDWGQDLKGLKRWMDRNGVDLVGLSYFGTADPRYYGIRFLYLPSIPFYYPGHEPADIGTRPRYFAISATNLQGVYLEPADRAIISRFQKERPVAKIGHSIFIYRSDTSE